VDKCGGYHGRGDGATDQGGILLAPSYNIIYIF